MLQPSRNVTGFAHDVESLVSPALAGAPLLFIEFNSLFVLNEIALGVSALLVFGVHRPSAKTVSDDASCPYKTTFGLRAYLATPRLRGLLAMSMAVSAAGAMVIINTVFYVQSHLGIGAVWTGALFATFGAGSMMAALLLPKLLNHTNEKSTALMATTLAFGVLTPGFTAISTLWF